MMDEQLMVSSSKLTLTEMGITNQSGLALVGVIKLMNDIVL